MLYVVVKVKWARLSVANENRTKEVIHSTLRH